MLLYGYIFDRNDLDSILKKIEVTFTVMHDQRSTWGLIFLDASVGLKFDVDNPDDIL